MHAVNTERAPAALGHYSQAIVSRGLVFASGQLPINPATGEIEAESIEEQVAQAMGNVSAILEAAGSSLSRVVKVTLYLGDMSLFARANAAYARAFGDHRPARSAVPTLTLPRGALVEIDVVAETAGAEVAGADAAGAEGTDSYG
jgi:2-iminobutanoate/2-iminopropanoate deaminase